MTTTLEPPVNGLTSSATAALRADGRVFPLVGVAGRELTLGRHSEGTDPPDIDLGDLPNVDGTWWSGQFRARESAAPTDAADRSGLRRSSRSVGQSRGPVVDG